MNRSKATTPEAESTSRGVERESLLDRLHANRGVRAMIGAAVLSTTLWLAGCGSVVENLGSQETPAIDPGKLRTAEGRIEVFETQGTAMALGIATAIANADNVAEVGNVNANPNEYILYIDKMDSERSQILEVAIKGFEIGKVPPGSTQLMFTIGGQISDSEGLVDTVVLLTMPESVLEQSQTPQSLRETIRDNEGAIEVATIASNQEGVDTQIVRKGDKLSINTLGVNVDDFDSEHVEQAEPFGEMMASALKTQTALLAQLQ